MTLAIETYADQRALDDAPSLLNLSWTLDEREWLAIDLDALIADLLTSETEQGLPWLHRYLVQDPYGSASLGPSVERFFSCDGLAADVTCAAGVNGLLHALAALADDAGVVCANGAYPDFPHWLRQRGILANALEDLVATGSGASPRFRGIVHLERPSLFGSAWGRLDALRGLCAQFREAIILIDESNANYCAPDFSAAPLTREFDNLLVLRGLSKAYGMGSLRLGFCVSSPALTGRVRSRLPALGVCSLSLMIARGILDCGDIGAPLRARIAAAKAEALALIAGHDAAAAAAALPCAEALPYLLFSAAPSWAAQDSGREGALRIRIKRYALWSAQGPCGIWRCSVPLRAERMALLRARLCAGRDRSGGA